MKIIITFI